MTIRTLIVDDEPIARRGIRHHLRDAADVEVVGECADGESAVAAIEELAPDLVFLDIQMPELDGFGVIEAIGVKRMPVVVFVTAYDEHALRAFEVNALDYLLKPIDGERFREALERVRTRLGPKHSDVSARLASVLEQIAASRGGRASAQRFALRSEGRVRFLAVAEVDWIGAAGNYVELHVGKQTHLMRETMNGVERRLDAGQFVRISRSTIVKVDCIRELQPMFSGDSVVVLRDGTKLAASRRYRSNLDALFG